MTLPNQITIGRLVLAVIFCVLLSQYDVRFHGRTAWMLHVAIWLFIVAAISDVVDGYLARRHNQVTSFGRIIDPFVDKVLICGAFILLAGRSFVDADGVVVSGVSGWMVVVIIGREILVSSLRIESESRGQSYAASAHGKIKMLVQSITIPWILADLVWFELPWWHTARDGWIWATVVITMLSMISYLARARSLLTGTPVA